MACADCRHDRRAARAGDRRETVGSAPDGPSDHCGLGPAPLSQPPRCRAAAARADLPGAPFAAADRAGTVQRRDRPTAVRGEGTVKTHVGRIYTKLAVRDRTAAAVFASPRAASRGCASRAAAPPGRCGLRPSLSSPPSPSYKCACTKHGCSFKRNASQVPARAQRWSVPYTAVTTAEHWKRGGHRRRPARTDQPARSAA